MRSVQFLECDYIGNEYDEPAQMKEPEVPADWLNENRCIILLSLLTKCGDPEYGH